MRFIRRHRNRLNSLYIRNIDHLRQKAEYKPIFQMYFDLVCIVIIYNSIIYSNNLIAYPRNREALYYS